MKKILMSFFILFSTCFVFSSTKQDVYALISYGYGDSFENAQKSYGRFTPCQLSSNLCCQEFSNDSLRSSIFNHGSYVQDLQNTMIHCIGENVFVGIGHSRGAEMLLHFVGEHNPAQLRALVLFGTPVSVWDVIKSKFFGDPTSVPDKTLESIQKIENKKLPIVLFHQKNDTLVTCAHSKLLCQALKLHGFENVYCVFMDDGGHNDLINFQGYRVLQSFYKHHSLPYDTTCATLTDLEFLPFKQ